MSKRRYRLFVNAGYSSSPSNMIDGIADVEIPPVWLDVEKKHHDYFIVDNSMTEKGSWVTKNTELGYSSWEGDVLNLDPYSEECEIFGISNRLSWNGVALYKDKFHASSIEKLCEALSRVKFCAWCAGDI
jgi:hypothetical protein